MAVNGMAMYKLPEFYNNSSPIELPKCMYKMNNYHIGSPIYESPVQSPETGDFKALEARQQNILKELESLRNEVNNLAGKFGVKLPEKSGPASLDFVVAASPEDPPLSVFAIQHLMNQQGITHFTATFVHSTATSTDQTMLPVFETPRKTMERKSPYILTVVWKNVPNLPSLVLSSSHTPLVGEYTIARHLCRTALPELYCKLSLSEQAQVDYWLGLTQSLLSGNSKEKASVIRNLNSHLGKNQFLVSNKLSLADIAVFSAVVKSNSAGSAPANVKEWLKKFPTFSPV